MSDATRLHTCSVCGKVAAWGKGWSWYGSLLQYDHAPESVEKMCSSACRKKHVPRASKAHKQALEEARKVRYPRVHDKPRWQ